MPLSAKQKKKMMQEKRAQKRAQEEEDLKRGQDYWAAQGWTERDFKLAADDKPSKGGPPIRSKKPHAYVARPAPKFIVYTGSKVPESDEESGPKEVPVKDQAVDKKRVQPPKKLYYDPTKLRTVFAKEPNEEIEKRKLASQRPLVRIKESAADEGFYYREVISMPVRPSWSYSMSKEELEKREEAYFREWLSNIYERYPPERLNYFEHNLEVWRQLWRTCEKSDIMVICADVRHPIFHFPPSLYEYIVMYLKKPFILALNKIDLVSQATLQRWINYFKHNYPQLHVVPYSSFPHDKTVTWEGLNKTRMRPRTIRRGKVPVGVREIYVKVREIVENQSELKGRLLEPLSFVSVHASKAAREVRRRMGLQESNLMAVPEEREDVEEKTADKPMPATDNRIERDRVIERERGKDHNAPDAPLRSGDEEDEEEEEEDQEESSQDEGSEDDEDSDDSAVDEQEEADEEEEEDSKTTDDERKAQAAAGGTAAAPSNSLQPPSSPKKKKKRERRAGSEPVKKGGEEEEDQEEPESSHYITLGLLGHPNSGKSSLINSLLGKKKVSVSKTPGHTKYFQTIFLNNTVRLCDSPGVVFPAVDMPKSLQILCGLYPIAQVREPYSSIQFLAERVPIEKIYGLDPHYDQDENVANNAQAPRRGDAPDEATAVPLHASNRPSAARPAPAPTPSSVASASQGGGMDEEDDTDDDEDDDGAGGGGDGVPGDGHHHDGGDTLRKRSKKKKKRVREREKKELLTHDVYDDLKAEDERDLRRREEKKRLEDMRLGVAPMTREERRKLLKKEKKSKRKHGVAAAPGEATSASETGGGAVVSRDLDSGVDADDDSGSGADALRIVDSDSDVTRSGVRRIGESNVQRGDSKNDQSMTLEYPWSAWTICEAYAQKKGYYTRNGGLDTYRAGNEVLRHAQEGRVVLYFEPPVITSDAPAPRTLHAPAVDSTQPPPSTETATDDADATTAPDVATVSSSSSSSSPSAPL